VALFEAVQRCDLAEVQAINARIRPTAEAFYAEPFFDMHNRMKEALVMLGRMRRAVVRPPLKKLGEAELARIRAALAAAGLERRIHLAAE
jgi:4-hydroxy-tetrahydrodipicolinate synthase